MGCFMGWWECTKLVMECLAEWPKAGKEGIKVYAGGTSVRKWKGGRTKGSVECKKTAGQESLTIILHL